MKPLATAAQAIFAAVDGRWQLAKLHLIEVSADRSHMISRKKRTRFVSSLRVRKSVECGCASDTVVAPDDDQSGGRIPVSEFVRLD